LWEELMQERRPVLVALMNILPVLIALVLVVVVILMAGHLMLPL
jgi:hypothetical protein